LHHLYFFGRTNKAELERAAAIPELAEDMRSRLNQLIGKLK
jgi:hypothetical protein